MCVRVSLIFFSPRCVPVWNLFLLICTFPFAIPRFFFVCDVVVVEFSCSCLHNALICLCYLPEDTPNNSFIFSHIYFCCLAFCVNVFQFSPIRSIFFEYFFHFFCYSIRKKTSEPKIRTNIRECHWNRNQMLIDSSTFWCTELCFSHSLMSSSDFFRYVNFAWHEMLKSTSLSSPFGMVQVGKRCGIYFQMARISFTKTIN